VWSRAGDRAPFGPAPVLAVRGLNLGQLAILRWDPGDIANADEERFVLPGFIAPPVEEPADAIYALLNWGPGEETTWKLLDLLCYRAHGGSGYGFTRADVLDMDVREAQWLIEQLGENRAAEAAAIKRGTARGRQS
jgi:hypothetical protein